MCGGLALTPCPSVAGYDGATDGWRDVRRGAYLTLERYQMDPSDVHPQHMHKPTMHSKVLMHKPPMHNVVHHGHSMQVLTGAVQNWSWKCWDQFVASTSMPTPLARCRCHKLQPQLFTGQKTCMNWLVDRSSSEQRVVAAAGRGEAGSRYAP